MLKAEYYIPFLWSHCIASTLSFQEPYFEVLGFGSMAVRDTFDSIAHMPKKSKPKVELYIIFKMSWAELYLSSLLQITIINFILSLDKKCLSKSMPTVLN